jgi:hypothetical protein
MDERPASENLQGMKPRERFDGAVQQRYGDLSAADDAADGMARGVTSWQTALRRMSKLRSDFKDADCCAN